MSRECGVCAMRGGLDLWKEDGTLVQFWIFGSVLHSALLL